MSINEKLVEQDKLIREQYEAISKLRTALEIVLNNGDDGEDSCKDKKESQSKLSEIIDRNNQMIIECKNKVNEILALLDLEF